MVDGHPLEITRAQAQQYAAELIAEGKEANTVRLRLVSLRAAIPIAAAGTAWATEDPVTPPGIPTAQQLEAPATALATGTRGPRQPDNSKPKAFPQSKP